MNISESLQKHFKNSGSIIQLERTDEGKLPKWLARFNSEKERGFQIETVYEEEEFIELYSVDLKEKNICFVRAAIINFEDAKQLIYNWIEKRIEIKKIEEKYFAFEKFIPINERINKYWNSWNEVKSHALSYSNYYNKIDGVSLKIYFEMLDEIIVHPYFSQLKPFASINGLTLNSEDYKFPSYFIAGGNDKYFIYQPPTYHVENEMMYSEYKFKKEFNTLNEALKFYQELLIKKNKN